MRIDMKGKPGRPWNLVLTAGCLALIYSLAVIGSNYHYHEAGCQQLQILLRNHQDMTSPPLDTHGTQAVETASHAVQTAAQTAAGPQHAVLHKTTLPIELPAAQGAPSDAWRPHVFTKCVAGMPQGYAPCLKYSNLLRGEELVYPDFRIRMPQAVDAAHNTTLYNFIKPRFRVEGDWAYYLNQHGRNFVFANTSYENNPVPEWSSSCCMCEGAPAPHSQFAPARVMPSHAEEEVMFAASPDSNSFQHWRDRTALMLTQARHLLSNDTKYIAATPRDNTVSDHWQLIVNATAQQLIVPSVVHARKLVFSCDTPLLHPYLVQRMSETMLSAAGLNPRGTPWDERKVLLLIGRGKDNGVHNGFERRWNNYDECKPKLQQLLQQRGQGERLEEWNLSKFSSLHDIMRFWNTQVRGAVGVHGSGLMNVHWASQQTVLFEIWPVTADKKCTRGLNVFWEQAALKGASYWWFHAQSDERWNVDVDCDLLVQAINKGLTEKYPPMLEHFYQGTMWSA